MQKSLELLKKHLEDAVMACCDGCKSVGIIFSGGIDSTLVAVLASKYAEVHCYIAGTEDSPDMLHAKEAEKVLKKKFKFNYVVIDKEILKAHLDDLLEIIQTPNPIHVGVGFPWYMVARAASKDGIKVMLAGQGADELFGGYDRYLGCVSEKGYAALEKLMLKDFKELEETNLWRDRRVCEVNGIELRLPFREEKLAKYAMQLPIDEKLKKVKGVKDFPKYPVDEVDGKLYIRKFILRELALELGVPEPVIKRKKKATQYGSNTQKLLDKIARSEGWKNRAKEKGRGDYVKMFLEDRFSRLNREK